MSIALDVGETPRPSIASRRTKKSGGENTVSQSLECRDTEGVITTLFSMDGGHFKAALLKDLR
eukprot:8422970-Heterocapsa_arctica.AAC.1